MFRNLLRARAHWEKQASQDQSLACVKVMTILRKTRVVIMIDGVEIYLAANSHWDTEGQESQVHVPGLGDSGPHSCVLS